MSNNNTHKQDSITGKPVNTAKFLSKLNTVYKDHPNLNLSLLTGWRYPGIPRLTGNPLLGRLTYLFSGEGILNNLMATAKLATDHPSDICYYWLANQLVLLNFLIPLDNRASLCSNKYSSNFFAPLGYVSK